MAKINEHPLMQPDFDRIKAVSLLVKKLGSNGCIWREEVQTGVHYWKVMTLFILKNYPDTEEYKS